MMQKSVFAIASMLPFLCQGQIEEPLDVLLERKTKAFETAMTTHTDLERDFSRRTVEENRKMIKELVEAKTTAELANMAYFEALQKQYAQIAANLDRPGAVTADQLNKQRQQADERLRNFTTQSAQALKQLNQLRTQGASLSASERESWEKRLQLADQQVETLKSLQDLAIEEKVALDESSAALTKSNENQLLLIKYFSKTSKDYGDFAKNAKERMGIWSNYGQILNSENDARAAKKTVPPQTKNSKKQ